jgi:hypothetical protein
VKRSNQILPTLFQDSVNDRGADGVEAPTVEMVEQIRNPQGRPQPGKMGAKLDKTLPRKAV